MIVLSFLFFKNLLLEFKTALSFQSHNLLYTHYFFPNALLDLLYMFKKLSPNSLTCLLIYQLSPQPFSPLPSGEQYFCSNFFFFSLGLLHIIILGPHLSSVWDLLSPWSCASFFLVLCHHFFEQSFID